MILSLLVVYLEFLGPGLRGFWFVLFFLGTLLGRKLRFRESLNQVILILRRSFGRSFLPKDLRSRHRINQWSSAGRITALWFLGIAFFMFLSY